MYADDIVLVASKEEFKNMSSRLEKYLDKRKLQVDVEKFKALVFSRGRRTERKWKDKILEEVREFNYLGITLT